MITGRLTRLRLVPRLDRGRPEIDPADAGDTSLNLLVETPDGRPIGRLDIDGIDHRHRSAEVTVTVDLPDRPSLALHEDALRAACRYLFAERMLHRLGLTLPGRDSDLISGYERLGFRREGVLRDHGRLDGEPTDEVALSLLAGELRD